MKNSIAKILSFILIVFFAWSAQPAHAQRERYDSATVDTSDEEYDEEEEDTFEESSEWEDKDKSKTVVPIQRIISSDSISKLKAQPEFAYMRYLDSALKAYQNTAIEQPPTQSDIEIETPSVLDSGAVRFVFYAGAIALVLFVLYRLFFGAGVFTRNRSQEMPEIELEETPDETDLEKSLRMALSKKDYRLAVRYLFLQTLYGLGERGVLNLSTDKTNYQYMTELSSKKYANEFAQLSLQYEYVWFGNFPVTETRFATIQQQHKQFLKQI
jgi:hypothetical protein